MKKLFMVIPLVLLLCFTFSCQKGEEVAEEPAVDIEAEEQAIRDVLQKTIEAKNRKDWDTVINMYAEKTIILDEGFPEEEYSLEDHREYYIKSHENIDFVEGGLKRAVISEAGEMAWSTGWNRNFYNDGAVGEMKWVAIWNKINNEWKCVVLCANFTKETKPEEEK